MDLLLILTTFLFLIPLVECQQCSSDSGRSAVPDQCDAYTECQHGTLETVLCPEGLVFNDRTTRKNSFPCSYPVEVDCGSRSRLQPAQPSEHCPHQYGLYNHEDTRNCGQFWSCVAGRAFLMDCPEGLAFSSLTVRCEWPDESPTCDPEAFLGFRCPAPDPELSALFLGEPRYPHPTDCRKFYVCVEDGTKPRLLSCESGFGFNPALLQCDEPENIPGCNVGVNKLQ